MLIATLAIAGIPGFAGFFSKDEILEAAQSGPHANLALWVLGVAGAALTSFYMFRLIFPHVFRQAALRRAPSARPRIAEEHDRAADDPRVPFDLRRLVRRAETRRRQSITSRTFLDPVFPTYAPRRWRRRCIDCDPPMRRSGSPAWNCSRADLLARDRRAFSACSSPGGSTSRVRTRRKRLAKSLHGAVHADLQQVLRRRNLRRADRPPASLDLDQRALARRRRGRDRRHGQRRRAPSRANRAAKLRKLQSGNTRSYASWVIIGAVGFTCLLLLVLGMR